MIKKKTFTIANEASVAAIDPKSLQCRVNLLDGEEIVQDFNVSLPQIDLVSPPMDAGVPVSPYMEMEVHS